MIEISVGSIFRLMRVSARDSFALSGITLTYPATGQVKVDFTCTAGQLVHVVANRDFNSENPY